MSDRRVNEDADDFASRLTRLLANAADGDDGLGDKGFPDLSKGVSV